MAIKGYSAFPKTPALLESHRQIVKSYILDTRWWGFYSSAEMQSVYSTAPADCAPRILDVYNVLQFTKPNIKIFWKN